MNSSQELSWSHLVLKGAWAVSVDLPASWVMDKFARPPSPDFSHFDMKAKRRILKGEIEDSTSASFSKLDHWWSPVSWMDKTEQWIQTWVDTSKNLATSAYQMKQTWDEMVEAKQAERDRLRSQEEFSDDDDDDNDEGSNISVDDKVRHIMPTVIVDSKPRLFVQNSPKNYATVSKKLAHQVFHNDDNNVEVVEEKRAEQQQQEIRRQNWRNKEIRSRSELQPQSTTGDDITPMENVSFAKTYSFRNLPKGRVAKVKQMFDHTPPALPERVCTIKRPPKPRLPAAAIIEKVKTTPTGIQQTERSCTQPNGLQIPIRAWEDKSASQPELSVIDLAKPRSRHGFHARSTPSVIEDNYIKEYLYAIKPLPPSSKQPQRSTASECKAARKQPLKSLLPYQREKYYAFENVDLQGRVISWTEVISIHSVYDISISEPVFV